MRESNHCRGAPIVCLGLVFALTSASIAADEGAESLPRLALSDAIARALHAGTRAQIARLEAGRAGDQLTASRAGFMPKLFVSGDLGYSNRIDDKLVAENRRGEFRTYPRSQIGSSGDGWFNLIVDQLIFDLSKWHEVAAKDLAAEAAEVAEDEEREMIAYEVARRFGAVARAERQLALADDRLASAEWLDDQASALFEEGRALEADRERIRLHLDEAGLAALEGAAEWEHAKEALAVAMGAPAETGFRCDPSSIPLDRSEGAGTPREAGRSPELRLLDLRRRMEDSKVQAARGARLPTIGMRAGYVNYGIKRFDDYQDELFVSLDVRIPLFDGFESGAEIAGALKASEIARLRYRQRLEEKEARVTELARLLGNSARRLDLATRRFAGAREQQRLADLNLRSGRGDLLGAMHARERVAQDGRHAAQAAFDRIEVWASLHREIGDLREVAGAGASMPGL